MKLVLNLSFFLIALFTFSEVSYSLTDYQIRKICKKRVREKESTCLKNLQEKKSNLLKGNLIEIPVIPYKGN